MIHCQLPIIPRVWCIIGSYAFFKKEFTALKPIFIYLIALVLISLVAFLIYGIDKKRARRNEWRIREAVLLGFGFFGGAIGALLGMKAFRHKTRHWYFWAVNVIGLLWQVALAVLLIVRFH